MWWSQRLVIEGSKGKGNTVSRTASMPKTKRLHDWSPPLEHTSKAQTWGTHAPGYKFAEGFDITLPELPSPFASPSKDMHTRHGAQVCLPRHARRKLPLRGDSKTNGGCGNSRRPSTSAGVVGPLATDESHKDLWGFQDPYSVLPGCQRPRSSSTPSGLRQPNSLPTLHNRQRPHTTGSFMHEDVDVLKLRQSVTEDVNVLKLMQVLNMPNAAMSQACDLFRRHADPASECDTSRSLKDCHLGQIGFANIWCEMTQQEQFAKESVPAHILKEFSRHTINGQTHGLGFSQFATWFSSRYFCEDVSLDHPRRQLRAIARKFSMHHGDVETYEQMFNKFDRDGNGIIDASEFEELLCECTKVPSTIGLPAGRVKNLWHVADEDGNQEINFDEFLTFFRRYLRSDSTGFEDFYSFAGRPASRAGVSA